MSYLRNLLATTFSSHASLSEAASRNILEAIRSNPDTGELAALRSELEALYQDPHADWIELLDNEQYEVYYAETQEGGRDFVTSNIWNTLFPENMKATA